MSSGYHVIGGGSPRIGLRPNDAMRCFTYSRFSTNQPFVPDS